MNRRSATPARSPTCWPPSAAGFTCSTTPDIASLHAVWASKMDSYTHYLCTWAAIGIYAGEEDNAISRRTAPRNVTLNQSAGKQLIAGDTVVLGDDTIHGVTSHPRTRRQLRHQPRSLGRRTRRGTAYNIDDAHRQFAEAGTDPTRRGVAAMAARHRQDLHADMR